MEEMNPTNNLIDRITGGFRQAQRASEQLVNVAVETAARTGVNKNDLHQQIDRTYQEQEQQQRQQQERWSTNNSFSGSRG